MPTDIDEIWIREMTFDDVKNAVAISRDPQVAPYQYRGSLFESARGWRTLLNLKEGHPIQVKCSTIMNRQEMIGVIVERHLRLKGTFVTCSWNLNPNHWGRGIMVQALTQLFDTMFQQSEIRRVDADCFRCNDRCIRVMEKLGFVPGKIRWPERVLIAITERCPHWINRYQLDANTWYQSRESPSQERDLSRR